MAKLKKGGFGGNIFGQNEQEPQAQEIVKQEEQVIESPVVPQPQKKKAKQPTIIPPKAQPKEEEVKRTRYTIMIDEELLQNVKLFATLKRRKIYEVFEIALTGYLDTNFTAEHRRRLEELQDFD